METCLEPQLPQAVRHFGRFDTEACYNCGSCAAVCELTEDGALFPCRALRLVQTGMRQELRGSLEPDGWPRSWAVDDRSPDSNIA